MRPGIPVSWSRALQDHHLLAPPSADASGLGLPHVGLLFCVLETPGSLGGHPCVPLQARGVSTQLLPACRSDCISLTLGLAASLPCSLTAWVSCFQPPWVALPDPALA